MRGMSTSIWIWIIGGLVVAMLTFTITFQSLVSVGETSNRNEIVDQFENLRNTARLYCMKGQGSMTTQSVSLTGVRAIYAADSRENPDPEVPHYISESQTAKGDYMCMKFEDSEEPYACYEMRCPVNVTYMGTPLKGTDMYVLGGEGGSYQFDLTIRKKTNALRIKAEHRP